MFTIDSKSLQDVLPADNFVTTHNSSASNFRDTIKEINLSPLFKKNIEYTDHHRGLTFSLKENI